MFARSSNPATEALLEECVAALMRGEDWRSRSDANEELEELMQVAEWLLEMRRREPRGGTGADDRVWRRIALQITREQIERERVERERALKELPNPPQGMRPSWSPLG